MKHFLESLEREVDFQRDYEKLVDMLVLQHVQTDNYGFESIESWISENFLNWEKRQNYTSFKELRTHLGFDYEWSGFMDKPVVHYSTVGMEEYFLFCEMIINLYYDLRYPYSGAPQDDHFNVIVDTMQYNITKAGFQIKKVKDELMIVEVNPVSIEVADIIPELGDVVIEYNHYLLKGNLSRKQEILKKLADALEPKRTQLKTINNTITEDFFWLVNKMNIRHNNCDPSDKGNYVPAFSSLSDQEKEEWYDRIYEQGLALFVLLDQKERSDLISQFKALL